jgi:hypothetical protein
MDSLNGFAWCRVVLHFSFLQKQEDPWIEYMPTYEEIQNFLEPVRKMFKLSRNWFPL